MNKIEIRELLDIFSLTIYRKLIQLDEHQPLISVPPGVSPFVQFGRHKDSTSTPSASSSIIHLYRIIERLMLQMSESHENRTSRRKVHTSGQIDVGLFPECVHCVFWSALGLNADACYRYTVEVELKSIFV